MSPSDPAGPRITAERTVRHAAVLRFLRRALAVTLVIVAQGFLAGVPHAPSDALGVAYAASAVCLGVAAWRLWWPTMR